jgi:NAD(P)-dependent dehydrogenase (short-subunit alcohol dehydrogenase family)
MIEAGQPIDLVHSVEHRTIFITGGLGGIGRAAVAAFLAHGAQVAFTYAVGQESIDDAQALVDTQPKRLSMHALDLRSVASIQQCMSDAMARWGRLDVLVNNAAVGSTTVARYSEDAFEQDSLMLNINADGALKMCQVFLKETASQGNSRNLKIINISSVGGGLQAFPDFRISDGMSKAAVAFLTKQLAAALVHRDVDVFAVCPGATRTRMLMASTLDPMSEEERATFLSNLPKQRLIEPMEIANILVFLSSDYGKAMHGAVIDASMGLGVRPGLQTESASRH